MGLDDFKQEDKITSSRKKVENIEFSAKAMRTLIAHEPHMVDLMLSFTSPDVSESDYKSVIAEINDILENGMDGERLSEETKNNLKDARSELKNQMQRL